MTGAGRAVRRHVSVWLRAERAIKDQQDRSRAAKGDEELAAADYFQPHHLAVEAFRGDKIVSVENRFENAKRRSGSPFIGWD